MNASFLLLTALLSVIGPFLFLGLSEKRQGLVLHRLDVMNNLLLP